MSFLDLDDNLLDIYKCVHCGTESGYAGFSTTIGRCDHALCNICCQIARDSIPEDCGRCNWFCIECSTSSHIQIDLRPWLYQNYHKYIHPLGGPNGMNLKWHSSSKDRYFGMELSSLHQEIAKVYTKRHADCKKMNKSRIVQIKKNSEPLYETTDSMWIYNRPDSIMKACKRILEMVEANIGNDDIKQINVKFY